MWSGFFITTTSKGAAVVFHNPGKGAEMDLSTLKNVKTEAVVHAAQVKNQDCHWDRSVETKYCVESQRSRHGFKQLKCHVYMCPVLWCGCIVRRCRHAQKSPEPESPKVQLSRSYKPHGKMTSPQAFWEQGLCWHWASWQMISEWLESREYTSLLQTGFMQLVIFTDICFFLNCRFYF